MDEHTKSAQQIIMIARRVQLSIGCVVLSTIIARICYMRLYKYNTTKAFMWCCLCYFFGMAIVLAHGDYITSGYKYSYDGQDPTIMTILQEMKSGNLLALCGLQAFLNLYAYDMGYFFAVLVTYNVYCVIHGNYHNFMKKVFSNLKIIILLLLMLIIYLLPLVMLYTTDKFDDDYTYSYAPTGFKLQIEEKSANLLLYCGINSNPSKILWNILAIVNIYICPFVMLVVHSIYLRSNRTKIKVFKNDSYLNSKQIFLIDSGKISFIVFIIQFVNFLKLFLTFFSSNSAYYIFILIFNFLFDMYPFLLLYYFVKYTREKRGLEHGSSTLLQED